MLQRLNAPMEGLTPDAQGWLWLDNPETYRNVMAADLPESAVKQLVAVQQPIHANVFGEKIGEAAWQHKASHYLITEQDNALPTAVQETLATQIKAKIHRTSSSHMSMWAKPDVVVGVIDTAAE